MNRNFKILSLLVVVLLVLSACGPSPGAMRGGGWMFGVNSEYKATFGFTGSSEMVDGCLESKGQFTYNDRSEGEGTEGIKFHGVIYKAEADEDWGVLRGTFEDEDGEYWFKASGKEEDGEIWLKMEVGNLGQRRPFYKHEGELQGGTINFWPEKVSKK